MVSFLIEYVWVNAQQVFILITYQELAQVLVLLVHMPTILQWDVNQSALLIHECLEKTLLTYVFWNAGLIETCMVIMKLALAFIIVRLAHSLTQIPEDVLILVLSDISLLMPQEDVRQAAKTVSLILSWEYVWLNVQSTQPITEILMTGFVNRNVHLIRMVIL